jgi:hypothetical protein
VAEKENISVLSNRHDYPAKVYFHEILLFFKKEVFSLFSGAFGSIIKALWYHVKYLKKDLNL